MNILIADDHGVIRLGVRQVIREILPDAVIHESEDFDQTIRTLNEYAVNLLILDINIPGGNNFQMVGTVKLKQPGIKVLIFSAFSEQLYALRYFKAGADGYLQKDTSEEEIKNAVKTVIGGHQYMSQEIRDHILQNLLRNGQHEDNPLVGLSDRETEIAKMLVHGLGQTVIAKRLNLHTSTVGTHKNRIFEKLSISNLAELIEKYRVYDQSA